MARSVTLAKHVTSDELLRHYRTARDSVERSHWQVVYLKSIGRPTSEISQVVGYSEGWVLELIKRYNREGRQGILDQRHEHPGSSPMLDQERQTELARALDSGRAPDGGPWTGPKVARWIEEETGRARVHDQRGWNYLVRLGFSAQAPRPRHQGASKEEQEALKNMLPERVAARRQRHAVELWAMDEHRLGLKPILREV